jgi:Uma2 family endonuclease
MTRSCPRPSPPNPMTDEEFAGFCAEHPDLFFETTAEGKIIVVPPTYSLTGARSVGISGQLYAWAERDGRGIACDSSTGFALAYGARRCPDAAWTLKSRVAQLDAASLEEYWHLCPDFVVELQSSTDRPRILKDKMREWLANGAQLGWLIDPERRSVEIYRPEGPVVTHTGIESSPARGRWPVLFSTLPACGIRSGFSTPGCRCHRVRGCAGVSPAWYARPAPHSGKVKRFSPRPDEPNHKPSPITVSPRSWARAAWAKCTAPPTPSSAARWRLRF